MITLTRDGLIVHGYTGITLGAWRRDDGAWQVWGGRRHLDLLACLPTRAALVRWVEGRCFDREAEAVSPLMPAA